MVKAQQLYPHYAQRKLRIASVFTATSPCKPATFNRHTRYLWPIVLPSHYLFSCYKASRACALSLLSITASKCYEYTYYQPNQNCC